LLYLHGHIGLGLSQGNKAAADLCSKGETFGCHAAGERSQHMHANIGFTNGQYRFAGAIFGYIACRPKAQTGMEQWFSSCMLGGLWKGLRK
jgi:hypothetical protein